MCFERVGVGARECAGARGVNQLEDGSIAPGGWCCASAFKEMVQPCLTYLHLISLGLAHQRFQPKSVRFSVSTAA